MKVRAGDLRHRIRFDALKDVVDTAGDPVRDQLTGAVQKAWGYVAECWAAKRPISGTELLLSEQLRSEVVVRFVIRARTDINAAMRIVCEGIAYDVAAIMEDPDSGFEWMTVQCKRGVNAG